MKTKLFFSSILSVILFASCNNNNIGDEMIFCKSFIQDFKISETLILTQDPEPPYTHFEALPANTIVGGFIGTKVTESDKAKYEQLTEYFGDETYNKYKQLPDKALGDVFDAAEIVSDCDFDDVHPAGTSLGDIFIFHGASANEYIKSGYTDLFDWNGYEYKSELYKYYSFIAFDGYHPVRKLVSELTAEDIQLINPDCFYLISTVSPIIRQHKLTVTFRNANKTVTGTINALFE